MGLNDWFTIIGALGGLEAIKWIVNFYVKRKTNARKEDASADAGGLRGHAGAVCADAAVFPAAGPAGGLWSYVQTVVYPVARSVLSSDHAGYPLDPAAGILLFWPERPVSHQPLRGGGGGLCPQLRRLFR